MTAMRSHKRHKYIGMKLIGDKLLNDVVHDAQHRNEAKRICSRIKLNETQKQQHKPLIKMAQENKFSQNHSLTNI